MDDPFRGSRLKVKRAKEHISELERELAAFRQRRPYRLVIEGDEKRTHYDLAIRIREDIPDRVTLLIGDAIHNLRCALDHALCDAIRKRQISIAKYHQFPIIEEDVANGNDLNAAIKQRHVDDAGPEVVQVIRAVNPTNMWNRELWALHNFDIDDKHKLLIPIAVTAGIPDLRFSNAVSSFGFLGAKTDVREHVVMRGPPIANLEIGQEADLDFEIEFPRGGFFQRESVVPTLFQLTHAVERVVESIAAAAI